MTTAHRPTATASAPSQVFDWHAETRLLGRRDGADLEALRAAIREGCEVSVTLSDKSLRLRVEDDGPGIPPERREALLLVGAGGFSYEEAANICGCAVGTIKSRVGRARAALNEMLADGDIPKRSIDDDTAHRAILEELDDVAAGNGLAEPTNGRT